MNKQKGVSLTGLVFWCIVIAMVALLGMKVVPSAIEYGKLIKDIKATASQVPKDATVPDVRKAFERYASIDGLDFHPNDLEITKDGGQIVISVNYEKRIPLFANVSLVIAYQGSSR